VPAFRGRTRRNTGRRLMGNTLMTFPVAMTMALGLKACGRQTVEGAKNG
jgi:hypothetical protein